MTTKTLKTTDLAAWLQAAQPTHRLVAPTQVDENLIDFAPITTPDQIVPHTHYVNTRQSIKQFFFPRSEPLLDFDRTPDGVDLHEPTTEFPNTLIYGCRPCDAASLPTMDALYGWDTRDSFWFQRREATTIVAIACTTADPSCFCTAVGGAPDATTGSDILLTPIDDTTFLAEIITPKGQALIDLAPTLFTDGTADKQAATQPARDTLPPPLDLDAVTTWLADHFDDEHYAQWSLKCLGCGCCTFLCPTCHCFDIVDEGSFRHGQRRKNWDACQFPTFTLHASGHNPRPDQAARWRQRLQHKFNYYVQKFDLRSCVGCGRCIRSCPVNMNIHAQLTQIATELAAK